MFDPVWSLLLVEGDYKAVVVGRESGALEKYRLNDLKGKALLRIKAAHTKTITALCLTPQGGDEIFSASTDASVRRWNLTDDVEQLEAENRGQRLVKTYATDAALHCGVVVVGAELFCCGGGDGKVYVVGEKLMKPWAGHKETISAVAQCQTENGENLLATASYDFDIRVWNTATAQSIFVLKGHSSQVKGVQFINGHLGVMGVGRDETMRLWLLPEDISSEGADGNGAGNNGYGDGGDEEEDGNAVNESAASSNGGASHKVKELPCAAVLGLPAAPLCLATQPESENPIIAVGLSGGTVVTVKANKFLSAVSNYTKINSTEVKKEVRRLNVLLKTEEKREKAQYMKSIRKKKKELLEEQQKEESDKKKKEREEKAAARLAARGGGVSAAHGGDDEDEEGEEEEEHPEEPEEEDIDDENDEEEEGGVALTEEREEKLTTFKEEQKKKSDEHLKTLRESVTERKKILEPIGIKKFERTAKELDTLSFTRTLPRAAEDSIYSVVLNGTKMIAASGSTLKVVDGTPGVQTI